VIRPATEADAPSLAQVQVRGWWRAYADFIPPEKMPEQEGCLARWRAAIPAGGVRVFDQDGAVAGYAYVRGDELAQLYVDPPAQGAGVGTLLLADAVERLRAEGHARAWLHVYADNEGGRAFYERHGWRRVGDLLGVGVWRAPGLRYERAL
jgi:GNAT superfamily N-acetyltransferase